MKRYTVSQVREQLSQALDEAEQGKAVVIERRGVRYSLKVERLVRRPHRRKSRISYMDPALEAGQWSWEWGPKGPEFRDLRKAK